MAVGESRPAQEPLFRWIVWPCWILGDGLPAGSSPGGPPRDHREAVVTTPGLRRTGTAQLCSITSS